MSETQDAGTARRLTRYIVFGLGCAAMLGAAAINEAMLDSGSLSLGAMQYEVIPLGGLFAVLAWNGALRRRRWAFVLMQCLALGGLGCTLAADIVFAVSAVLQGAAFTLLPQGNSLNGAGLTLLLLLLATLFGCVATWTGWRNGWFYSAVSGGR